MEYIVKVSDLYQRAKEMLNDGMEYVRVDCVKPDGEIPACISFTAWRKCDDFEVDYDELDALDPSEAYSESVE